MEILVNLGTLAQPLQTDGQMSALALPRWPTAVQQGLMMAEGQKKFWHRLASEPRVKFEKNLLCPRNRGSKRVLALGIPRSQGILRIEHRIGFLAHYCLGPTCCIIF